MKRAFRIIVPMILLIAVLMCLCWYFLVYDQAFTKELLLRQARYFEENSNHKAAEWMYDLAYYQSHQDDAIAIELSNQYKKAGNYTKAEYTLWEAISTNPTAELYIELCKLYVEQDKLMDAVNMLDTIGNAQIRTRLDAMRPAAPVLTPEAGFYSQYITVDPVYAGGKLYIACDGEYPSLTKDLFAGSIVLPLGETVIYALVVGDNGLVSPLTISGYTVGGVVEPVTFADAAIEAEVRKILSLHKSAVILTSDLWTITNFTVPAEATELKDLLQLTKLTSLSIRNFRSDLSFLSDIPGLQELTLDGCWLDSKEMTAIGSLANLRSLSLAGCGLSSVSPLEPLQNLQYLNLADNSIRNISPLSRMTKLKELYMGSNALVNLQALENITTLEVLDVSYNSIHSLSHISGLTDLNRLDASHNLLETTEFLADMVELTYLDLNNNAINDATGIAGCTALTYLNLSNNKLTDISTLNSLNQLAQFNFSYNEVKALPEFSADSLLVSIDGSHNLIEELKSLSGLRRLNTVLMDYNPKLEDLKPLEKCPVLIRVSAYGTKVSEVKFLTSQSIIVNYDPTQKK